ncbi:MAG: hypothetical protein M1818_000983 [Claussenomyces sp. TS43310]|nr:MAG: hypothetical protein M1818_000983 [Claussenomyces sp. TS43310]
MLLSSPRITLRRAGSFTNQDRGPLSSTSSRFNFNHLIQSPPPSPGLPALVPRHGKPLPSPIPRRLVRLVCWLLAAATLLYLAFNHVYSLSSLTSAGWSIYSKQAHEMVGDDSLPGFPTPLVISNKRGGPRWTVSIPLDYDFPLEPEVYNDICHQTEEVSEHVAELHGHKHVHHAAHYGYYHVDPYFMDVAEAEELGMLPGPRNSGTLSRGKDGHLVGEKGSDLVEMDVCDRSMTFVLEAGMAGLGQTLMMLWSAYGLAMKEERAFFVDDSKWAYGDYETYFSAPPPPLCRPPARHEMLPCPHHAQHLVVSAATAPYTLGETFNEAFEDARKTEVYRQKPIFALARAGYEALFKLAPLEKEYVSKRLSELSAKTAITSTTPNEEVKNGMLVGIHVRHGDKHPMEYQYSDSYIPLDRYHDRAFHAIQATFNHSGPNQEENMMAEQRSLVIVASDDPEVYNSIEFAKTPRAQEQIRLAAKNSMAVKETEPSGHVLFKRFVEESVGWEGGFFEGMFWSLGRAPAVAGEIQLPGPQVAPGAEATRLRELVGRAYLMDLAVLGGASDKIICTISSMTCKLLAVIMGWERAMEKQSWINIDGDYEWTGIMW